MKLYPHVLDGQNPPLLSIPTEDYLRGYNLDLSDYVEQNNFLSKSQKRNISYIPYNIIWHQFRMMYPKLEVGHSLSDSGSFLFKELYKNSEDEFGYYTMPYIYSTEDGAATLPWYYAGIAGNSAVVSTGRVDMSVLNRLIARGIAKCIGFYTGIGLKLWTGEDLETNILEEKEAMLNKIADLYTRACELGYTETVPNLTLQSPSKEIDKWGFSLKSYIDSHTI